jgi:hypothetical protein
MQKSESIKELATALCKFQGAVEKIKKTTTNPFFKSKYANLADILDVIRQPLADAGLSFVQFPKGQHELETMLMHVSGEWMSETYEMPPTKNDPQGLGSAITYQRRYALGAILGLNIDEDDDGNKASEPQKTKQTEQPQVVWVTEKQFLKVKELLLSENETAIESGRANFRALTKEPYAMKKEYRTELETIINNLK